MNLSPQDLSYLFHNYPQFEFSTPTSIHPNDRPIYKVRIIPLDLGKQIAAEDNEEKYFHVELFPLLNRAELWNAQAWRESISRRIKLATVARDADPSTPLIVRLNHLEEQLKHALCSQIHLRYANASGVAVLVLRGALTPDQQAFIELLGLPAELLLSIKQTKDELARINNPNSSIEPSQAPSDGPRGEDPQGV